MPSPRTLLAVSLAVLSLLFCFVSVPLADAHRFASDNASVPTRRPPTSRSTQQDLTHSHNQFLPTYLAVAFPLIWVLLALGRFVQAGMGTLAAYDLNLALNSMFIVGTLASWVLLTHFGRRTLYILGLSTMSSVLLIIGALGFSSSATAKWASGALLVALNFVYNATIGAVCYVIISEVGSTRLRAKTIVLSRCAYQVMNIVCGIIVPDMLSPTAWNWGPKCGLFWFGVAGLSAAYCWLRVPETRGRSYGELDILFENKVPAWRFASTKVDQFSLGAGILSPVDDKHSQMSKQE